MNQVIGGQLLNDIGSLLREASTITDQNKKLYETLQQGRKYRLYVGIGLIVAFLVTQAVSIAAVIMCKTSL